MENTDINDKDKDCLDPENNSKFCFFKVANAFLLLANVLLIVIGFYYLPNKESKTTSWEIVSATLSILVTVLIGWQIFSLIKLESVRKEYRDIDKKTSEAKEEISKELSLQYGDMCLMFGTKYMENFVKGLDDITGVGHAYGMFVQAIRGYLSSDGKEAKIEICLNCMRDCLYFVHQNSAWHLVFNEESYNGLNNDYNELLELIHNMPRAQLNTFEIIHRSRVERQLHSTILASKEPPQHP